MSYVSGFLTPVEAVRKDEYLAAAEAAWPLFADYGALEHIECWGDNVPPGAQTDFRRAVDLKDGEVVCFSWILWPDKAASDRWEAAMQTDERFATLAMPFDGRRMVYGGFDVAFAARR